MLHTVEGRLLNNHLSAALSYQAILRTEMD